MMSTINRTAGEILGYKDLDIIDDYITDDDLAAHRDEIITRMRAAVQAIEEAAVHMMTELYYEAAAPYCHTNIPRSFTLRTSEYHDILGDALIQLKRDGFFVEADQ